MVESAIGSARPGPVSAFAGALFVQLMGNKTSDDGAWPQEWVAAGPGDLTSPPAGTGSPASSMPGTIGDPPRLSIWEA